MNHAPQLPNRIGSQGRPSCLSALVIVSIVGLASTSRAAIPDLTWGDPEVVDTGVSAASFSAAPSVLRLVHSDITLDAWSVAYVKDGDIYLAVRNTSGWLPSMRVSNDPASSSRPSLGAFHDGVCVVWEDERTGHAEIWSRSWDGNVWSAEQCLSEDAVPSRAPAFDADGYAGLVAWQDDPVGQPSRVMARYWTDGVFAPTQVVSNGSADAREPAVAIGRHFGHISVVWSDLRHGEAELYGRESDMWDGNLGAEVRLTDVAGNCRHPSMADRPCCGDWINPERVVAFENDASGVSEVWALCYEEESAGDPIALSTLDGVASHAPRVAGRAFVSAYLGWGGPEPRYSVVWADDTGGPSKLMRLAELQPCSDPTGFEVLSTAAAGAAIGACDAWVGVDPLSKLLGVWLADEGGLLVAREATILGCHYQQPVGTASLLLTPKGVPANRINFFDLCTGEPASPAQFRLDMAPALEAALTWDPSFPTPPITRNSDTNGHADFALHGGGCSQAGTATLKANGLTVWAWNGAKSPDVDGDCAVREDDLAYVRSQLGTADFCADLDGSGTVDAADVALVLATFGDRCFTLTDVADADAITTPHLQLFPNPAREQSVLRFDLPAPARAEITILDVAGRVVRRWSGVSAVAGSNLLSFDGRDDGGRRLAAGWYLARLAIPGRVLTQPFVRVE